MMARILLIEDNPQNRYLACFLLERRGHTVMQAQTGQQGLDMAAALRPDIILLDIQLPGMDGYAVTRQLKSDEALRHIPIVAVTSFAMQGDQAKCREAGAEGYIEKPINPQSFVAEIEAFLARPASPGAADTI